MADSAPGVAAQQKRRFLTRWRRWKLGRQRRGAWWWRSYTVEVWLAGHYCVLARRSWWLRPLGYFDGEPYDWHKVAGWIADAEKGQFHGHVDELAVYARELSSEQVEAHYRASLPAMEGREQLLDDCRAAFAQIRKLAPGPANWQDIDWICDKALTALDHTGEPGRGQGGSS